MPSWANSTYRRSQISPNGKHLSKPSLVRTACPPGCKALGKFRRGCVLSFRSKSSQEGARRSSAVPPQSAGRVTFTPRACGFRYSLMGATRPPCTLCRAAPSQLRTQSRPHILPSPSLTLSRSTAAASGRLHWPKLAREPCRMCRSSQEEAEAVTGQGKREWTMRMILVYCAARSPCQPIPTTSLCSPWRQLANGVGRR